MFYTVYRTTNLINGKFYIGTHKTSDPNDSYLGSGTLLKRAIEKYGVDVFKKEVLFVFDNPEAMFAKEAELVTAEFLAENNTYNLKLGGFGGFDWINQTGANVDISEQRRRRPELIAQAARAGNETKRLKWKTDEDYRRRVSSSRQKSALAQIARNGEIFTALNQTDWFRANRNKGIAAAAERGSYSGSRNSQFGSMWITNGVSNKKIKKGDQIPEGWKPGRTYNAL